MARRATTKEAVEGFEAVHGGRYDYSKVVYTGNKNKVIVVCKEHGEFLIRPNDHTSKRAGCSKCSVVNRAKLQTLPQEEVIETFKIVHGDRYDYSKVVYVRTMDKVTVICKEHGEFEIAPNHHRYGTGCANCGEVKRASSYTLTQEEVIVDFRKIHGDRYDYSLVEYTYSKTKVIVLCGEHGEFLITPNAHKRGDGCAKCSWETHHLKALMNNPEQFHLPRQVYFVNFKHVETGIQFSKVGVCDSGGLVRRYRESQLEADGVGITNSQIVQTDNITALSFEWYIMKKFREYSLDTRNILKACGGGTETFSINLMHRNRWTLSQWLGHFIKDETMRWEGVIMPIGLYKQEEVV